MGIGVSTPSASHRINFEDMQWATQSQPIIIISTLGIERQNCLLPGTVSPNEEAKTINEFLKRNTGVKIVVYGECASDDSVSLKYAQLVSLGFTNVYVYQGGIFEWLLLQDVYGEEMFPTIGHEIDILKYKGNRKLGVLMIEH